MTPDDRANPLQQRIHWISTIAAGLATQLPGISFFLGVAPPEFRALTLLTGGGAVAIFLVVFQTSKPKKKCVTAGAWLIAAAVVLAIGYQFLFHSVTVGAPESRPSVERYQIGFGLAPFSLTEEAKAVMKERRLVTPTALMVAFGGYEEGRTRLIWKHWSIVLAGLLLCGLFVVTYISWAAGLAYLSRSFRPQE